MNEQKHKDRNGYYERSFDTCSTLELKVPRTRDGHFSPTVFERYQRNENPHGFNVGNVCIRRFNS